jgi:general stress protein 26
MGDLSLPELAKRMKDIDYAMLITTTADGALAGRPMSNNGDVEYQGTSYFFCHEHAHSIREIEGNANVALSFAGGRGLLNTRPLFIAVEGRANLIRDREAFIAHWRKDLDAWFEQGIDTPGLVLIEVRATRLHYWHGKEEGEIPLRRPM